MRCAVLTFARRGGRISHSAHRPHRQPCSRTGSGSALRLRISLRIALLIDMLGVLSEPLVLMRTQQDGNVVKEDRIPLLHLACNLFIFAACLRCSAAMRCSRLVVLMVVFLPVGGGGAAAQTADLGADCGGSPRIVVVPAVLTRIRPTCCRGS